MANQGFGEISVKTLVVAGGGRSQQALREQLGF